MEIRLASLKSRPTQKTQTDHTPRSKVEPNSVNPSQHARLVVYPQETAQTIEGFGVSGAWWPQSIGTWPPKKRSHIMDLLFGSNGIGLTIYRYNIGAGSGSEIADPWRRTETFETSPGKYNWSRDAGAVRIMLEACRRGVKRVILFANSPPRRMTKSGHAYAHKGKELSNLRNDRYEAYATYLVDIARHIKNKLKVPVHSVSPINEPQWDWTRNTQEGCHYEPDEAVRLVEILLREVRKQKLDIRVDALESAHWELLKDINGQHFSASPVYVDTLFSNAYIDENIDSYSLHSYRTHPKDKKAFSEYFFGMYRGKKLHMSEWCETQSGRDYGMDSALRLAREVIDDIVLGNVSSWQYWIAVSKYDWHDGLIYVNDNDKTVQPTKRLWVLGNFSRFIRPGFRRVNAYCDEPDIQVLAAKCQPTGVLTIVVSNSGYQEVVAKLHLVGIRTPLRCEVWETSQNYHLRKTTHTHMDSPQMFPGRSAVTLVFSPIQKI